MKSTELRRAKRRVRREVLAARDALSPEERASTGELAVERLLGLPELKRARSVMAFSSFGSEVPTLTLIERLHASRVLVALPRIEDGELLPVTFAPGDPTTPTSFGALEPADGTTLSPGTLDVVVVPGVAFDRGGRRIGYGGGFYDRFLKTVPAFAVGLAFGLQVLDRELAAGRFDVRLDAVVTEDEVIRAAT